MFPPKELEKRGLELLNELDALAESGTLEEDTACALEDLNAEFEDAILLLTEMKPDDEDWREELEDALDEFESLGEELGRMAGRSEALAGLSKRLVMLTQMARNNLDA